MNISFQKTFYIFACSAALVIFLYFGKPILVPISVAILFSFILYPIAFKIESWGIGRLWSAFLSIFAVVIVTLGLLYLFSTQIIKITSDLSEFGDRLKMIFNQTISFINNKVPLIPDIKENDLMDKSQELVKKSGAGFLKNALSNTASLFSGLVLVLVYTFLLLIYRSGIKKVLIAMGQEKSKKKISDLIMEVQKVGQGYLVGMSIMIIILGTADSLALLAFNIDHAILFGFMASLLTIIPYVGTTLGATIPVLYALMSSDSIWVPVGIAGTFWVIQIIESNFLSPKIVGGNLNVNALVAIISLIIGGYIWGIAGMALFLPFAAIFRVFCSYFDELKPLSMLLGNDLYDLGSRKVGKIKFDIKRVLKK